MKRAASFEGRILLLALAGGLPAVVACVVLFAIGGYEVREQITFDGIIIACWLGFCFSCRDHVANPLRTLANLLEAMREGDYSIRGRVSDSEEPMGEEMLQVNARAVTRRGK